MSVPDEIIHQSHRLRIMAALDAEPEALGFSRLKAISGATDGNLGAHLGTLERAGYVHIEKRADGRRTLTLVHLTPDGRQAFRAHSEFLQSVLIRSHSHRKEPQR